MQKMAAPLRMNSEEAADQRDNAEMIAAFQKREAEKQSKDDKIGAIFEGKWFITNWTDPILMHPILKSQMSVSRFYPQVWIAIDIFVSIGPWEQKEIDIKREAFKTQAADFGGQKHKVRYAVMSYTDNLAALAPQLES